MDPAQPRAEAVALAGGRFLAVGTSADVANLATAHTKKMDLGGKTVLPGFIDTHSHPAYAGYRHLTQVDCALDSIGKIVAALRERAAKTAPGDWVQGFKYDDTKTAEGRFLTRDAAGVRTGLGDEWVRVGAVKMVADGSISERTARMREPYVGRPDDRGIVVTPEAELYETGRKAHQAGWQIGTHANGDEAIDTVLRVYERLQRESPRKDPRFRLEHCTLIDDALVRRIKALGVIPAPFSTYVYWHGEKMKEYGAERLERMFAVRSFLDAGVRVTQASDYPPGPFEPMMALQSQVTRTDMKGTVWGAKQRVSVEEAIRVGTLHGAYASFEESLKGSIETGKLADLVVLGRDPLAEPPGSLVSIPIERTMTGGNWVFES
jgi:predicted amidohydrolase YtcJ